MLYTSFCGGGSKLVVPISGEKGNCINDDKSTMELA